MRWFDAIFTPMRTVVRGATTRRVEVIPMDYINTAYERMLESDVRYRFVIDMATME